MTPPALTPPALTPPATHPCLAILPAALEEVIRCLPVLDALAAGGRRLLALVESDVVPLLALVPAVSEPVPRLPDLPAMRAMVRSAGCGEAVVLSRRLDDAWLARTSGIPECWGYRTFPIGWLLHRRVEAPKRRLEAQRPASEDFRELAVAMGAPWRSPVPRLEIGDAHRQGAGERLERAHVERGSGPLVGIYPGTAGGGCERPWPRSRFEELVRELRSRHRKAQIIVLATTSDLWTAVRIHEETGKIHPVIGPDLTLDALAALLAELDVVVAVESWMLDLAAAAGTPTVGLFVRDPARWAPRGKGHRALHAGSAGALRAIGLDPVTEVVGAMLELR